MRVALLLSGEIRDTMNSLSILKKNFLDLYNPDIYISTWRNTKEIQQSKMFDTPPPDDSGYDMILKNYNPIAMDVESYNRGYNDRWKSLVKENESKLESNANLVSTISMWYKVMRVNNLKSDYEKTMGFKYDIVVKSRPDLKLETPVELKVPTQNTIYIPRGWDWSGGINDLFAYGTSESMDLYTNVFSNFVEVANSMKIINPERLLKQYLFLKTDLIVERPEIDVSLRDMNIKETWAWC